MGRAVCPVELLFRSQTPETHPVLEWLQRLYQQLLLRRHQRRAPRPCVRQRQAHTHLLAILAPRTKAVVRPCNRTVCRDVRPRHCCNAE